MALVRAAARRKARMRRQSGMMQSKRIDTTETVGLI